MALVTQLLKPEELDRLSVEELDQIRDVVGLELLRSQEVKKVLRRAIVREHKGIEGEDIRGKQ